MSVINYYEQSNGTLTSAATNTTSGNTVLTNELMVVTSGSAVTGALLGTSAVDLTGSGTAVSNPGGNLWVYNGGSISAGGVTFGLTGGAAVIESGGSLVSATVGAGAGVIVEAGAATSVTTLINGFEAIESGGVTSGTVVSSGEQYVYSGGLASATAMVGTGDQQVYNGGQVVSAAVGGLSTQNIQSGGVANNNTITGGATQTVHAGGSAWENVVVGGASDVYGTSISATVSGSGTENVMSGGTAQSTTVTSGGHEVISAGGKAVSAVDQILGLQVVSAGGVAYNTTVTGGEIDVASGGLAQTPVVSSGQIIVSAGGQVVSATVIGGTIEVMTGGTATNSNLTGGQQILFGGTTSGTVIGNQGSEVVVSGSSINAIVEAGGSETVYTGGSVTGLQVQGAGVVSLQSGAKVTGDIVFSGSGGKLQLIGATLPAVTVAGLGVGDTIDLSNLTVTAASYTNSALTLTESNGATVSIGLGNAPDGTLSVKSDGAGGTLITINPFTAAAAISAFQANNLPGGAAIADNAAAISTDMDSLQSLAAANKLVSIALTDSGMPTVSVSAAQLVSDSGAIGHILGTFTLDVSAAVANVTIAGLSNHATVVGFAGSSGEYGISSGGDGTSLTVTDTGTGRTSVDHISGVTALQFSDVTEIVASATHPAGTILSSLNVAELYAAALTRAPDVTGLNYYEGVIKANPTLSGQTLAEYFLSSAEYTGAHTYAQTSTGDTQFVSDLYTNVLHRTGSTAEISFYTAVISQALNGLTAGTAAYTQAELQSHALVLEYFSASAEFLSDIQITAQHPASAQHWLQLI